MFYEFLRRTNGEFETFDKSTILKSLKSKIIEEFKMEQKVKNPLDNVFTKVKSDI